MATALAMFAFVRGLTCLCMTGAMFPCTRSKQKAASREADARALETGKKTREQLRKENGAFAFPRARVRLGKPTRSKF